MLRARFTSAHPSRRSRCASRAFIAGIAFALAGCDAERQGRPAAKSADMPVVVGESVVQEAEAPGTESYAPIAENDFRKVNEEPLSTFSIDVDTASYANVRRFLARGTLPPKDAVRIEELVNYFPYSYTPPDDDSAFVANVEIAGCPWQPGHRLARIALKGREIRQEKRPPSNLVFLLDVSGSMDSPDKLPLLQSAMKILVGQLGADDRVAIVVYAGAEGLALPSTPCKDQQAILSAIDRLSPAGSTNGGAGIALAYDVAGNHFIPGGTNRVILCTDGDFNVGITSQDALVELVREKARGKVFLSVLGFGQGNLQDAMMERLADLGNGNYAYIDSLGEAKKVLAEQMTGTLVTIAKDVKIQVEFNPAEVAAYRLIGYENRLLAARDFNDDRKDAGEIGAGHCVTALYELVPPGVEINAPGVDPLKYARPEAAAIAVGTDVAPPAPGESLTVKIRFKAPEGDVSKKIERGFADDGREISGASGDFRFAAAVAEFGMLLRDSSRKGNSTFAGVLELAESGLGSDLPGHRQEFLGLVRAARALAGNSDRR